MDEKTARIIGTAAAFVREHMSTFDASHDYNHVVRVLALAKLILEDENASPPRPSNVPREETNNREPVPCIGLSEPVVVLGALLHDVNDGKYLNQSERPISLGDLLMQWGAGDQLARRVERLCQGVSYSTEIRDPELIGHLIQEIPELAVVQDADRLDAMGAVGIGRCFTFGASRGRGMPDSIRHLEEKLLRFERLMKTRKGKAMARARTEQMREFLRWWDEETQVGRTNGFLA